MVGPQEQQEKEDEVSTSWMQMQRCLLPGGGAVQRGALSREARGLDLISVLCDP